MPSLSVADLEAPPSSGAGLELPVRIEIVALLIDERSHQPVERFALAFVESGVRENCHAPHGAAGVSRRTARCG